MLCIHSCKSFIVTISTLFQRTLLNPSRNSITPQTGACFLPPLLACAASTLSVFGVPISAAEILPEQASQASFFEK